MLKDSFLAALCNMPPFIAILFVIFACAVLVCSWVIVSKQLKNYVKQETHNIDVQNLQKQLDRLEKDGEKIVNKLDEMAKGIYQKIDQLGQQILDIYKER